MGWARSLSLCVCVCVDTSARERLIAGQRRRLRCPTQAGELCHCYSVRARRRYQAPAGSLSMSHDACHKVSYRKSCRRATLRCLRIAPSAHTTIARRRNHSARLFYSKAAPQLATAAVAAAVAAAEAAAAAVYRRNRRGRAHRTKATQSFWFICRIALARATILRQHWSRQMVLCARTRATLTVESTVHGNIRGSLVQSPYSQWAILL